MCHLETLVSWKPIAQYWFYYYKAEISVCRASEVSWMASGRYRAKNKNQIHVDFLKNIQVWYLAKGYDEGRGEGASSKFDFRDNT